MADTSLIVFNASGQSAYIDMRTEATNAEGRQVVVLGDPSVNAGVAEVVSLPQAENSTSYGIVSRIAGSVRVHPATGATFPISGTLTGVTNTIAVYFDRGDPGVKITSGTVTGITNSIAVHLLSTGGTLIIKPDRAGTFFTNGANTSSIFTVSGSTSGGTTSGVTLVAPSASYNFKIFAYSIQTTGVVSSAIRFTNGAESATELWRPLITAAATTSSPVGANLAVPAPSFIFATGVNVTLALRNDSGSLVHYSVSYIKESA